MNTRQQKLAALHEELARQDEAFEAATKSVQTTEGVEVAIPRPLLDALVDTTKTPNITIACAFVGVRG